MKPSLFPGLMPLFAALFFCSCTGGGKLIKVGGTVDVEIRYINLRIIYAAAYKMSGKAEFLKNERERIDKKSKEQDVANIKRGNLKKVRELEKREVRLKEKLMREIENAVKEYAEVNDIDFVLNIGDEVIYGKSKYDITGDVLEEYYRMKKRGSPLNR